MNRSKSTSKRLTGLLDPGDLFQVDPDRLPSAEQPSASICTGDHDSHNRAINYDHSKEA